MKKNFLLLLLFLTINGLFAQIKFEKGYFVSNSGEKTDCYIKNVDWVNNTINFNYKLTMDGEVKTEKLIAVKSFVIPNICKYEKHTVNIDMSTKDYGKLNYDKKPEWQEKTVFLNVLIEGEATLYRYKNGELGRFFYKKGDTKVKQLVHKNYLSKDGKLAENNEYRQQLYTDLACESISRQNVANLNYNRSDFISFFTSYNSCKNNNFISYKQKSKGKLNIRGNIGMNLQKTSLSSELFGFGIRQVSNNNTQEWSPKVGIDIEYVFGFNRNKWAAFIAPSYLSYKGKGEITRQSTGFIYKYDVEYSAIQLPIGIRHYMFLNDSSKLFLNFGLSVDFKIDAKLTGLLTNLNDSLKTSSSFLMGIGYSYNNRYFIEIQYITPRELIEKTARTSLKLNQVSVSVGYRFL